jgi:cytochrome c
MDSFEWNKIIGAVLGTLLFVMVVKLGTEAFFETAPPAKAGYVVQGVVETASTSAAPVEEAMPDWGTVLPTADAAKGQDISHKCEQCHDLSKGGPNKIGPNLWDIVNAPRGTGRGGFDFSAAMKAKGGTWTFDELFKFLKSPGAYIPGTKMTFAGLPSAKDRIDLIAWLRTQADSPAAIPPPSPAKAAAPASAAPASTPPAAGTAPPKAPAASAPSPAKATAPAAPTGTPAAPKK